MPKGVCQVNNLSAAATWGRKSLFWISQPAFGSRGFTVLDGGTEGKFENTAEEARCVGTSERCRTWVAGAIIWAEAEWVEEPVTFSLGIKIELEEGCVCTDGMRGHKDAWEGYATKGTSDGAGTDGAGGIRKRCKGFSRMGSGTAEFQACLVQNRTFG